MSTIFKEYQAKPLRKMAVLLTEENAEEIERHTSVEMKRTVRYLPNYKTFVVSTLNGNVHANIGDYLIQGIDNEYYPCKASIFEKSYWEVQ